MQWNYYNLAQADFIFYISWIGKCCNSARTAGGDDKDEALSAEPIYTNNSIQTNKVSWFWLMVMN